MRGSALSFWELNLTDRSGPALQRDSSALGSQIHSRPNAEREGGGKDAFVIVFTLNILIPVKNDFFQV